MAEKKKGMIGLRTLPIWMGVSLVCVIAALGLLAIAGSQSGGEGNAREMNELLAWAIERLSAGLTVDDLARHAAVSPRTLTRRFRQATGLAPGEWLQAERLRLARRLLETSDDPIERVARNAGYDTPVAMRAQFARRLRTSPRAYRRTFRPV